MEYKVAFEIAQNGIGELAFILPGLLFIIIGVGLICFRNKLAQSRPKWFVNIFSFFFFGFAVFWTLTAGLSIGSKQTSLREDYVNGNFTVTEGIVRNFDPMPSSGHKMESFTVNGTRFEYSDFVVTPGFNNATSRGGPIKERLPVRISHIGNTILKLEIASSANQSTHSITGSAGSE
jgi:hypothetical protein